MQESEAGESWVGSWRGWKWNEANTEMEKEKLWNANAIQANVVYSRAMKSWGDSDNWVNMKGMSAYSQNEYSKGKRKQQWPKKYIWFSFYYLLFVCSLLLVFFFTRFATIFTVRLMHMFIVLLPHTIRNEESLQKRGDILTPWSAPFCFWRPSNAFSFHYINVLRTHQCARSNTLQQKARILLPQSHGSSFTFTRPKITILYHTNTHTKFIAWLAKQK